MHTHIPPSILHMLRTIMTTRALPAPDPRVMGVVGFYEWVVTQPKSPKVPPVFGGFVCECEDAIMPGLEENQNAHTMHNQQLTSIKKLTPSRQRLHLQENHSLITRWETGDDCLVKINSCRYVVFGELPYTIAAA